MESESSSPAYNPDGEPAIRLIFRYIRWQAWLFAGLCMLVPVGTVFVNSAVAEINDAFSTTGAQVRALPGGIAMIGAVGAAVCVLSSFRILEAKTHTAFCLLITASIWAAFFLVFNVYVGATLGELCELCHVDATGKCSC